MALPATDAFTGTNGTALPTYSANWTNATNGMRIQTNRASGITGDAGNMAWWDADTFNSAHYSKGLYPVSSPGNGPGPAVRCQSGAQSCYYCFCDGTTVFNGQMIAGALNDWDGGQTVAVNDVVELSIDETTTTTVYFKRNGTTVATYTSKSALSGGAAGVCMYHNTTSTGIDNWEGGNVGAGGVPGPPGLFLQAIPRASRF